MSLPSERENIFCGGRVGENITSMNKKIEKESQTLLNQLLFIYLLRYHRVFVLDESQIGILEK